MGHSIGSLEDKSAKNNAHNKDMVQKVSQGNSISS